MMSVRNRRIGLGGGRERPRRSTAKQRDELGPPHSITSSEVPPLGWTSCVTRLSHR
jgi:hypothetical protein